MSVSGEVSVITFKVLFAIVIMAAAGCSGGVGDNNDGAISTARSSLKRDMHPDVTAGDKATLANDTTAFAFDVYQKLVEKTPDKNIFISPYSISSALAMTFAGAKGQTAEQMAKALRFSLPADRLHPAFNALDLALESRGQEVVKNGEPFELAIATALWGQQGFPFEQAFLDLLAKNYGAGMMLVDFVQSAEKARMAINAWVADHTHDRIKDLLMPGTVTEQTRLVLTNTIYFHAGWESKFSKKLTESASFHNLDSGVVTVDMMHMGSTIELPYMKDQDFQAVALPYVGENVEMVVILPEQDRFKTVEAALDGQGFQAVLKNMKLQLGKVSLPKFGMEYKTSVGALLRALGMELAFTERADFSGMAKDGGLFISDVIHQTFLNVDEDGTEAAGATAVMMVGSSAPQDPPFDMVVDRPFIFAIVDRPTGTVLILGRVTSL